MTKRVSRRSINRFAIALPGVALVGGASGAWGQATYPNPFKMGAVLNLTGPTAGQGADFRAGLELAAQQWNAKGGIGGSKIEIVFEDHAAQPAKAVTAAQKLIQVDGVKVLANVYSSPVLAVVPIAQKDKVLQISAGATSPRLVNISPYFMTSVANAALEVEVMLGFAKKKLGASKIAILYGIDDFGSGVRDSAKAVWAKMVAPSWQTRASIRAKPISRPWQPLCRRQARRNLCCAGGRRHWHVGQADPQAGFTKPLLGQQGSEAPELFIVAGSAAENSYWTSAATTIAKDKETPSIPPTRPPSTATRRSTRAPTTISP
jgi:branched-chain amino acid transport system substrate-binding protein